MAIINKVEMSLKDYDELKETLSIYEEIIEAITTPEIEDWDLEWYKEHEEASIYVKKPDILNSLSKKSSEYLRNLLYIRAKECLHIKGLENECLDIKDISVSLFTINHIPVEE